METKELYEKFEETFKEVISPYLDKNLPRNMHTEPIWYIIDNLHDWRKFRSGLAILFAKQYGVSIDAVLPIAATSELIYAVSLVQDDIIDGDDTRGETKAAHKVFGIPKTVAACDYVYGCVNAMLETLNQHTTTEIFSEIRQAYAESQKKLYASFILEKSNQNNINLSSKDIFDIYLKKTVTGVNMSYCMALLCKKAPKTLPKDIIKYSELLAIAGQIKNDIYDLVSWKNYPEIRGYSDIKNGYVTYALRKLLDQASESEKTIIVGALNGEIDVNEVLDLIKTYKIIEQCIEDCNIYAQKAITVIEKYKEIKDIAIAWAEGHRRFSKPI